MKRSVERILTTHTGSLPRPAEMVELLWAAERGEPAPAETFNEAARRAVHETVQRQIEAGIDIVNDGEQAKPSYATYVKDRLTGFDGESAAALVRGEARDFPEWAERRALAAATAFKRPACTGPIDWRDFAGVEREIDALREATEGARVEEVFMTAASPGVIANFLANEYYPSHEAYLDALVAVMREEYEAIHRAGFVLQIDCPDLAMTRHNRYVDRSTEEFLELARLSVDTINEATRNIPSDRIRIHLCWGNYEGPHHLDIALAEILDIVLRANADGISFEAANPRHEHEWALWEQRKLPAGKVLIPGVVDSTTNFIEHPELIAQRITRLANLVGTENVIAGTDCGFGTFATTDTVDARIAWAKLAAMADGARLASAQLW